MASLSVILCTRDRRPGLVRCLKSIADSAQTCGRATDIEVVVVDDGSQDGPAEAVQAFAAENARLDVRLVRQPGLGLSAARNAGVAHASGAVLAFIDDDCIASPTYIAELIARFAGERELGVRGGRVLLGDPLDAPLTINPSDRLERLGRRADVGGFVLGCNMAMRREVPARPGPVD